MRLPERPKPDFTADEVDVAAAIMLDVGLSLKDHLSDRGVYTGVLARNHGISVARYVGRSIDSVVDFAKFEVADVIGDDRLKTLDRIYFATRLTICRAVANSDRAFIGSSYDEVSDVITRFTSKYAIGLSEFVEITGSAEAIS